MRIVQGSLRRDVVDRMLKGMVGSKPAPTLENIGQIADGLGLNAVLMSLPSAHLRRLSLPAALELPEAEGLVLVTGSARGNLRVVDLVKVSVGSILPNFIRSAGLPCSHLQPSSFHCYQEIRC